MSFLPDDYKGIPTESNYMKFEDGKNRFRVLGSAVVGMEYWKTIEGKRTPIRKRMNEEINQAELEKNKYGKIDNPKHFWAFPVYNHNVNKIQILEITQKSVMLAIKGLVSSDDWGDPKDYDIIVDKEGKDLETNYSVLPAPKKELDSEIVKQYQRRHINLEALFTGKDPFATDESINVEDLPEDLVTDSEYTEADVAAKLHKKVS